MSSERTRGDVATKLLFENERVRVWEMRLAPGERSPVHAHALDNLLIQIDGDRIAVEPEPDTTGPYTEYLEADVWPGHVLYVERGGVERAYNCGKRPYFEILVELKDEPASR
ncbi:MAG: cupin [Myxococcota bacterium]|nr:hypothetical protein [Myxococcales bacterium]